MTNNKWHLAKTEQEYKVTDFELQLWRVFFGFLRWQQECERNVNHTNLTGQDLSVLHIIRMKERPKSIPDIARLLNRDDIFNIQYSVRKLIKMGLIKKIKLPNNKAISYCATPAGIQNTDNMAKARNELLVKLFNDAENIDLENITQSLVKLKYIYDEAEHEAASHHSIGMTTNS